MYNREEFDREYFEQGPMTGKSLYTNYRWLPELTLPLCHHIVTYCGIESEERILDLETELYYCRRNKKLTTCTFCNRNDGTCGCGKKPDCGIGCEI